MEHQTVDVAIIGGGPAGLAAACAIRRRCPHLRVLVFERGPAVPRKGANGAASFTAAGLKELATQAMHSVHANNHNQQPPDALQAPPWPSIPMALLL